MTANAFLQLAIYLVVLIALAKPLGAFMARVYDGKRTWLSPVLGPIERLIYRVSSRGAFNASASSRRSRATSSKGR